MDKGDVNMHLRTAWGARGQVSCCGLKFQHDTPESAQGHADSLNQRREVLTGEQYRCEPYPCPWCSYWHVGREMTEEERKQWS